MAKFKARQRKLQLLVATLGSGRSSYHGHVGLVERFDHAMITPHQDPVSIGLIARIMQVIGLSK
jgi:hypothetical protein